MASSAWDRAQDAIAHASRRATDRDEEVVTPDTAVSPFDASSTTVLPHAMTSRRRGPGGDPDLTQRLPQGETRRADAHAAAPPDEDEDATTVRFVARRSSTHPGTSPFPATPFPGDAAPAHDDEPADRDEAPDADPERPWWRRMFGG